MGQANRIYMGRQGARRLKDRRFSFRALYLTCLVLTVLALVSFWPERRHASLGLTGEQIFARKADKVEVSDEAVCDGIRCHNALLTFIAVQIGTQCRRR